jgi:hypothetical protein
MRPISGLVSVWFGIVMVVIVLFLGCLVAFTDFMSDRLFGGKRTFFIVLMFAYALYRSYRIYQLYQQKNEE